MVRSPQPVLAGAKASLLAVGYSVYTARFLLNGGNITALRIELSCKG